MRFICWFGNFFCFFLYLFIIIFHIWRIEVLFIFLRNKKKTNQVTHLEWSWSSHIKYICIKLDK